MYLVSKLGAKLNVIDPQTFEVSSIAVMCHTQFHTLRMFICISHLQYVDQAFIPTVSSRTCVKCVSGLSCLTEQIKFAWPTSQRSLAEVFFNNIVNLPTATMFL